MDTRQRETKWTDRQTNKEHAASRQTDKQTDVHACMNSRFGQTDRQTGKLRCETQDETKRQIDKQTGRQKYEILKQSKLDKNFSTTKLGERINC